MCKNAKIITLIFRRMSCRLDITKRRRLVKGQAHASVPIIKIYFSMLFICDLKSVVKKVTFCYNFYIPIKE